MLACKQRIRWKHDFREKEAFPPQIGGKEAKKSYPKSSHKYC